MHGYAGAGYKGLLITTINITENGETATEVRVYSIKQDRSATTNPQAFWSVGGSVLLVVQGLGLAMSTVPSEKNRELLQ